MTNMKDVMLDLETLGTRHDAMIIQIGACYFDRNTGEIGDIFAVNINPGKFGDRFSVDYETIKWWFEQSDDARKLVMKGPSGIGWALTELDSFLQEDVYLWSHATFDVPILLNAFKAMELPFKVPFRNMRDIRTLMDLANHRSSLERTGTHHNAIDDAMFQAKYVSEAIRKLNDRTQT
jgi:DNA polymerase III epsilon subunit-like protein